MIISMRSWLSEFCGNLLTYWQGELKDTIEIAEPGKRFITVGELPKWFFATFKCTDVDIITLYSNSSALKMELPLSCTNPSKCSGILPEIRDGSHEWMIVQHNEAEERRASLRSYHQCLHFTASQRGWGPINCISISFVFSLCALMTTNTWKSHST